MIRIISLELKKLSLWKYLLGGLIILITTLVFVIIPAYLMRGEEVLYNTPNEFLESSSIILRVVFTIFIGIMIANVITKEYETGTILNLFLYPISKKKILISKLLLVISVSFLLMLISYFIVGGFISYFNNTHQIISGTITLAQFKTFILSSLVPMVATVATSMISLFVGLKMKSSVATIVSAIVIALLLNGQLGTTHRLSTNMLVLVTLSIIGCLIVYMSVKNVDKEDI